VSSCRRAKLDDYRLAIAGDISLVGIGRSSVDQKAHHSNAPVRTAIPVPIARTIWKLNAVTREHHAGVSEKAPKVRVPSHLAARLRMNVNHPVAVGVDAALSERELWPRNAADNHHVSSMPVITPARGLFGAGHDDERDEHTGPDHRKADPEETFATPTLPRVGEIACHRRSPISDDVQAAATPPPNFPGDMTSITFLWPAVLWSILLIPLLAAVYVRVLRRPARHPVTFSTQSTLARAASASSPYRRHVGAALFGVAGVLLVLAAARPVAPIPVPADQSAIILSIDVSGSMRSQDILPTRLEAAKAAATTFLDSMPGRVRVGLVVFAGFATLLVSPTTEHQRIKDAIAGLGYARRTAIGEGLLEAVAALPGRVRPGPDGVLPPVPPGPKPSGIVVLLSDGNSNAGIPPLDAAEIARAQDVTAYTVGIGQPMSTSAWQIGGSLDQETLQSIATITGGTYYHASSAEGLRQIYRRLARSIGWVQRPTEISAVTAAAAAVVLLGSLSAWVLMHPAGL